MFLTYADGRKEEVHLDKITSRIQKFCYGLNMDFVDPVSYPLSYPSPSHSLAVSHTTCRSIVYTSQELHT